MKKLFFLFVLSITLMSADNFESHDFSDEISVDTEILVDYEVTVNENDPEILVYTCTVTRFNPDYTITQVTRTSFISARQACSYAYEAIISGEQE